jgi:hypothetical protein
METGSSTGRLLSAGMRLVAAQQPVGADGRTGYEELDDGSPPVYAPPNAVNSFTESFNNAVTPVTDAFVKFGDKLDETFTW